MFGISLDGLVDHRRDAECEENLVKVDKILKEQREYVGLSKSSIPVVYQKVRRLSNPIVNTK